MKEPGRTAPVIQVKNVTKTFKDVTAVDDVSLQFRQGEFTALLGPNGAGKTTLIEMIEGIQEPDSGEIRILGRAWHDGKNALRRSLGVALQETRFIDRLTVEETLRLFASFYGIKRRDAMKARTGRTR